MSKLPPDKIKRHFVGVTAHTLHAVRLAGDTLEFCGECALAEKTAVQKLVQTWSEDTSVGAIAAVAPQPVWWQLADPKETRRLRSDTDVRRFAARSPYGLRGPLEVIGCNASDGLPPSPEGEGRWLLGITSGNSLAAAAAEAIERGVVTTALGSSTLSNIAAAATVEGAGVVRLWDIGLKHSNVFTIGLQGVEAITPCATGFDAILSATQEVLGGRTSAEVARLLFHHPGDPALAAHLARVLGPPLAHALRAAPPATRPASLACTGLTGKQAWLIREVARAIGLPLWSADLDRYLDHLQLRNETDSQRKPSLDLLGTLHLAAMHTQGNPAWRPVWGGISRLSRPPTAFPNIGSAALPLADDSQAPAADPPPEAFAESPAAPPEPSRPPTSSIQAVIPVDAPPKSGTATLGSPRFPASAAAASQTRVAAATPVEPPRVPPPLSPSRLTDVAPSTAAESPSPKPRTAPPLPLPPQAVAPPTPAQAPESRIAGVPPAPFPPRSAPPPVPPHEPVVIVLRKRGYWPHIALVLALAGAAIAGKFYLDAEAVKAAAAQEKLAAAEEKSRIDQQKSAAEEQMRLAAEQLERAEQRARELAQSNLLQAEQNQEKATATREAEIAQARREAEERTRRLLEPELQAARAAAPGVLKITTVPPGADVVVGGRPAQRAPASIEGLSPGQHQVKITLAGYVPLERTVEIVGSKTTDLGAITLERATGNIAVSSTPAGVGFSIRPVGTPSASAPLRRGQTPAQLNNLPSGEYIVQFTRPEWPEQTQRVTIERNATARAATTFTGGTVILSSNPAGAIVTQNEIVRGTTPLTLTDMPPREVMFELRADGYEPLKLTGTVVAGRELQLEGQLQDLDRLASEEELRTPPRPYITTPLQLGRIPRSAPPYITVSFVVLRDGSLYDVAVEEEIDRKLAQRAIDAIAKWKYYPGVSKGGYPVNVRVKLPVKLTRS